MFADWEVCFQTCIDLYMLDSIKAPVKISRAIQVMGHQASLPQNDFWYWADALYMAMPVMTRLYKLNGGGIYLGKLYECLALGERQ